MGQSGGRVLDASWIWVLKVGLARTAGRSCCCFIWIGSYGSGAGERWLDVCVGCRGSCRRWRCWTGVARHRWAAVAGKVGEGGNATDGSIVAIELVLTY
ncbi:hypothetical protein ACLOJK_036788 [Asimina triloba]